MNDILSIINRSYSLFDADLIELENELIESITNSSFLVIGGAGSIGQSVSIEIFKRNPKTLHIVDISENNLVELVRTLRSTIGYTSGDFRTFAIDCCQPEFFALIDNHGPYDYILNLSALKHVRSEKDPFTLMRMIRTNIFNTVETYRNAQKIGASKYFCVSTDKAANPVNLMGASKRIMELCLSYEFQDLSFSMSRFANVAFSDGSLLHGFNQRFLKKQPISAPFDTRRYFVTPQEAGELCLLSTIFGKTNQIFFPKDSHELELTSFSDIAKNYIFSKGYEPVICETESEARSRIDDFLKVKKWPLYLFESSTTGEKLYEEFFTKEEKVDMDAFRNVGVIDNTLPFDASAIREFYHGIQSLLDAGVWHKNQILDLMKIVLPSLCHNETGHYLDDRM